MYIYIYTYCVCVFPKINSMFRNMFRDRIFQESSVVGNAQVCGSGKATADWSM